MSQNRTRDKILMAAIDLFSQQGFIETSMKEIAQRCHIQAASIYFHFSSKKDILDEILAMYSRKTQSQVPDLLSPSITIPPGITAKEAVRLIFYNFSGDDGVYVKILQIILHEQYRNEEIHQMMKQGFLVQTEIYIKLVLDQLVQVGSLPSVDTDQCAKIINSINLACMLDYSHYVMCGTPEPQRLDRLALMDFFLDTLTRQFPTENT